MGSDQIEVRYFGLPDWMSGCTHHLRLPITLSFLCSTLTTWYRLRLHVYANPHFFQIIFFMVLQMVLVEQL